MSVEGKVANRTMIKTKMGVTKDQTLCERCNTIIDAPKDATISENGTTLYLKSYVGTDRYIYEGRSGHAICYCSKWCCKKHNHRFK